MSNLKKKHIVKLHQGECAVVMSYDTFMYLAQTCDIMASQQEDDTDAQSWRSIADEIRYQADETYFEEQQEDTW